MRLPVLGALLCMAFSAKAVISPNQAHQLTHQVQVLLKGKGVRVLKGRSPDTNQPCFLAVALTPYHGESFIHILIGEGEPPRYSQQTLAFASPSKFFVEASWADRNGSLRSPTKFGVSQFDVSDEHLFLERHALISDPDRVWRWQSSHLEISVKGGDVTQAVGKLGERQLRCRILP